MSCRQIHLINVISGRLCEADHGGESCDVAPGMRLCDSCIAETRKRLSEIPWLAEQFVSRPQWNPEYGGGPAKRDRRTMPLSAAAIELRIWTSSILESWTALVVSEDVSALPPARAINTAVHFLNGRLPWLAAHPSAADFVVEISDIHRSWMRFLQGSDDADRVIGECPEPGCGAFLAMHMRATGESALVRCGNDHTWPVDEWVRGQQSLAVAQEIPRAERSTLPTKVAAEVFGIQEATIRQWARRGRLTRYGQPGRAEYDIHELAELVGARTS